MFHNPRHPERGYYSDKRNIQIAIDTLLAISARMGDKADSVRAFNSAKDILLNAGWSEGRINSLIAKRGGLLRRTLDWITGYPSDEGKMSNTKTLKCLVCHKPSPVDSFEPGMLNEEATLTCPVCKSQFALYATIKSLGGKQDKGKEGEEGIEPPEGAPPPPAPPAEVGGGAGSAPPPNSAPAGASPFESIVLRCDKCESSWLDGHVPVQDACPFCGSGDQLHESLDTVQDRVAQAVGMLKEGMDVEEAVDKLLGEKSESDLWREMEIQDLKDERSGLTRCRNCGAWIDPTYGADSPAEHMDHEGTIDDPRAPGDYDDICDACCYGEEEEEREFESLTESDMWEGSLAEFTTKLQAMFKDLESEDVDLGEVVEKLKSSGALTIKGDKCKFSIGKAKSTIGTFMAEREPKMAGNAEVHGDLDVDPTMEEPGGPGMGGSGDMEPGLKELPKPDFGDSVERSLVKFF